MGQEAEHGEVVVVAVAGGIEKRGRKMSGDQEVEIEEREGMMMDGVARHPQEEALHQEEILGIEMVEVLGDQAPGTILHVTAVVQEEGGGILATGEGPLQGELVTGLHPGEDLLLGADLPQGEAPLQGVALHSAEDPVTMDLLTGAVTDLLHVTTLPLPNLADQPVIIKMRAGQLLSVRPKVSWDYPGSLDICQITRYYHASRILLAPAT